MRPINEAGPTDRTCFRVEDALDAETCRKLVELARSSGFAPTGADYPPSYRDNDRLVWDDEGLAAELFARLRCVLPEELAEGGRRFRLVGLNTRFRFCRYRDGQSFRVHQDGAFTAPDGRRSLLTLQIYLDDGAAMTGGRTRFYASRFGAELFAITPRRGRAIVFDHLFWHDGEAVTRGEKHVLRTDVVYEPEGEARATVAEERHVLEGHRGHVYRVLARRDGTLASASRDRTMRLWREGEGGFRTTHVLEGHDASVVALAALGDESLVSGSRDHTLRAWDLSRGEGRVLARFDAAVLALEPLVGGGFAAGCGAGTVRAFTRAGRPEVELDAHDGWVWSLAALSPTSLASASEDGTVAVWDLAVARRVASVSLGRGPVHAVARVDREHIVAGCADGSLVVLALEGTSRRLSVVHAARVHQGEVYGLDVLAPDCVVSVGEDGAARITHVPTLAKMASAPHPAFVRSVAALPGGRFVTGAYDGMLRVLDVGALVPSFAADARRVSERHTA